MALVEAVVGELVEQVPHLLGLGLADPVRLRPLQEQGLLRVHLRLDLLAHRPAQEVGAAEAEARQLAGDLHHLLLVDDDALGLVEHPVDGRMQALARLAAVLDVAELGDVLHRPGAVERDQRDDVLDAGGLELAQRVAHARALHLEHPDDLAPRHRARRPWGRRAGSSPMSSSIPRAAQQVERVLDHRQRLQPEEVELDEPRLLDPLHVVLGRRHVRARVAVERHQLDQRPVADHHPRRVGGGVAVEPLDRPGDLEQPLRPAGRAGPRRAAAAPRPAPSRSLRASPPPSGSASPAGRPGRRASAAPARRRAPPPWRAARRR